MKSRRQGLSPRTIEFYQKSLGKVNLLRLKAEANEIKKFLDNLTCNNGGKHAYYRALRAFYNWLFSAKSGYNLNPQNNPMLIVEPPKVEIRILPSLTNEQVNTLLDVADNLRDRCIISLFADSGMRLSELTNVRLDNIDWETHTITIIGKGNKQRRAPFTERTTRLLKAYLANNHNGNGNMWRISRWGIITLLRKLEAKTDIPCNPHAFRRGFACNLHRKGLSTLDIMHLGGWSDLSMVLRYTRSITFDDCLAHYQKALTIS